MMLLRRNLLFGLFTAIGLVLSSSSSISWAFTMHHRDDRTWQQYKQAYSKSYATPEEEAERYEIWKQEYKQITEHNERYLRGFVSFEQGINGFSDMTWDEIQSIYLASNWAGMGSVGLGTSLSLSSKEGEEFEVDFGESLGGQTLPASVNWFEQGWVSPVWDQGRCGSGWAFAAAGALEGQMRNSTGCFLQLSVQQMLECDPISDGCNGGFSHLAMFYTRSNGIAAWSDYPYTGTPLYCRDQDFPPVFENSRGVKTVLYATEHELHELVASYGPVAIGIHAAHDFFRYRSGVYQSDMCDGQNLNHAVLAVGYDQTSTGDEYWLIKNSWGVSWGEEGYIRMKRNDNEMCGLGVYSTVPKI